jgi:DNA-binding transcriptional ArsR family regulator
MQQKDDPQGRTVNDSGLGQRMRRALERRRRPGIIQPSHVPKRSLMMNPLRRAIYSELSRWPGLSSGDLARALKTSRANINWHLERLAGARLLSKLKIGGRWAYQPTNLLSDEELSMFCVLNDTMTRRVYLTIRKRPRVSQAELSKALDHSRQDLSWHLGKLSRASLITTILDGRFRRYCISPLFDELASIHSRHIGRFKGSLMAALNEDSLAPSIIKSLSSSLIVRLNYGEGSCVLDVVTDPYGALLKPKERAKKIPRKEK